MIDLRLGDCLEIMKTLPDNSVDACVTDPPYGWSFMGKRWDYDVPAVEVWHEVYRVLKPGAHILVACGTRTQHRMAVNIEDAGFEIRDVITWLYGSGFPKSHDISKAIDREAGAERDVIGVVHPDYAVKNGTTFGGNVPLAEHWNNLTAPATPAALYWQGWGTAIKPSVEMWTLAQKPLTTSGYCAIMFQRLDILWRSLCAQIAKSAEKSSQHTRPGLSEAKGDSALNNVPTNTGEVHESETETGRAEGTYLEADTLESIPETERTALSTIWSWNSILAEAYNQMSKCTTSTEIEATIDWKTLSYSLSQTTLADITPDESRPSGLSAHASGAARYSSAALMKLQSTLELIALAPASKTLNSPDLKPNMAMWTLARKPISEGTIAANVLKWGTGGINIDGCRVATDDETRRVKGGWQREYVGAGGYKSVNAFEYRARTGRFPANLILDEEAGALLDEQSGGASRFFYTAKASRSERDAGLEGMPLVYSPNTEDVPNPKRDVRPDNHYHNGHPTVKPISLMRYLCRLITPPGGVVLDPFMGSGTTGCAAGLEGFSFIGIELDADYHEIARRRIEHWSEQPALPVYA